MSIRVRSKLSEVAEVGEVTCRVFYLRIHATIMMHARLAHGMMHALASPCPFSAMYTGTSQTIFSELSTSLYVALWEIVSAPLEIVAQAVSAP